MKLKPILIETKEILPNGVTSDGEWFISEEGFGKFVDNDVDIVRHHIYLVDPDCKYADEISGFILHDNSFSAYVNRPDCQMVFDAKIKACTNNNIPSVPKLSQEAIKSLVGYYKQHKCMPDEVEVERETKYTTNRNCNNCYHYQWSKMFKEHLCKNPHTSFHSCKRKIEWEAKENHVFNLVTNDKGEIDIIFPKEKKYTIEDLFQVYNLRGRDGEISRTTESLKNWISKNL